MPDFGALALKFHGALLVGAIAAWYKYGDRTDLTDKSLKGTKEAIDELRAYLGRALAQAVRPTVERILANNTGPDGRLLNVAAIQILGELSGENFQDDVSTFASSEMDEMTRYRMLIQARKNWSVWAKRISWGVYTLLFVQLGFTGFFAVFTKALGLPVALSALLGTLGVSAAVGLFCMCCWGAMLRHHDKISSYRDQIL